MAQCAKCKKEVGRYFTYNLAYKGKIYCRDCYSKVIAKDKEKQKKERHIKDANMAILKEYNFKPRELIIYLIKTWIPRNSNIETDYTKSLKTFLDRELTPVDIYVGKESGLDLSLIHI